ncbi:MAG: D-alanine--D-alanine ligase [candidate division KSB1 bacterium]|nr:D-alanine--D-alanine ligase [candidate division KSB1 bacterium]MDZ7356360.1 D-alanine--D-alanine ligase [candidate division KSB1 bacterium]MDZ7401052.1 D-alanine--D-alanine ligase [candidate division KSB1 bacterium]
MDQKNRKGPETVNKKIRVAIIFGGKSAEHEVSLQSAKNVIEAIDKKKYEVLSIGIDKEGQWYLGEPSRFFLNADDPKRIALNLNNAQRIALIPSGQAGNELVSLTNYQSLGHIDVVFPVLHGPYGEDGTIQGLLKLFNTPFVGAGVLGSAVGMDKDVMKRLLRDGGVPVPKFLVFHDSQLASIDFDDVTKQLGLPFFVKPANLGSSVGIHKVKERAHFTPALQDAFLYDTKILIEEYIHCREIECSVLGNEDPIASIPGEIIPQHEFYSYEAKYIDEHGAKLEIPANLAPELMQRFQALAIQTYRVLCCEGMARVDFFLRDNREIFVSEINTIPGFTKISMYPKLWEASGIPYSELIDRLIQLALKRFEKERKLKASFVI